MTKMTKWDVLMLNMLLSAECKIFSDNLLNVNTPGWSAFM